MVKVSKLEAVVSLPKFGKVEKNVCGPCQLGKQTKSSHPNGSHKDGKLGWQEVHHGCG